MKKHHRYFIAGVLTVFLPIGILILLLFRLSFLFEDLVFTGKNSKNDIYIASEIKSPNQKLIATTFSYSGGGAAGWTGRKINLRKSEEVLDDKEYVLSTSNGTNIQTRWESDSTLQITFSTDEEHLSLYQTANSKDGSVKIIYNK